VGRLVDGSLPGLARTVRKSPTMVVRAALCSSELPVCSRSGPSRRPSSDPPGPESARWSGNETRRAVPRNKGQRGRPSQVICRPYEPILAEIHQLSAPLDPRTLAMVQCATRHFEKKPAGGGQRFAFLTQFFFHVQIGSNRWDFHTFGQISAIQIDIVAYRYQYDIRDYTTYGREGCERKGCEKLSKLVIFSHTLLSSF